MFEESFAKVLHDIQEKEVVIVGAGKYGLELATELIDRTFTILYFFDNKDDLDGLSAYGVPIKKPCRIDGHDICYVIAVDDALNRYMLKTQLIDIGIPETEICIYYPHRCLDYNATLPSEEYKSAIEKMYINEFNHPMNWDHPITYNEKINWEKMNLHDNRRALLADKNKVREWVADKIGEEHLTKQLGVWERPEDIDFARLPDKFALKTNNGSGRNILIKDKGMLNIKDIQAKLHYWLESNHMFEHFEMHYGEIQPCIIAEEYLEGMAETLYDYNIYCFHGAPKFIWCIKGSHRPGCSATFYDTNWIVQPFSYGYPLDIFQAPKPEKLNEMLELTRILCAEFDHVRVDWYIMPDGRVLFGEMTFQSWGGMKKIVPQKYDAYLGSLI